MTSNGYYISLGCSCIVADALRNIGQRLEALPFDWLLDHRLENIADYIKKGFPVFGAIKEMKFMGYTKHKVNVQTPKGIGLTIAPIYDNKKKTRFFHDFPRRFKNENDPVYKNFKDKYTRRFKRLNELFASGKRLILVRYQINPALLSKDKVIQLVKTIKSKLTNGTTMILILLLVKPSQESKAWLIGLKKHGVELVALPDKMKYSENKAMATKWKKLLKIENFK